MFDNKKVLITGGTGTFGREFVKQMLNTKVKKLYVFSRDELKQHEMKLMYKDNPRISYLIGDVKDQDRLYRAFNGIDIVVHASALKQVPSCEYNPYEAIKTNIIGAQNVVNASIDRGVSRVIGISTDKAVEPSNLYGATKLCQEKVFISGNSYVGDGPTKFSIVRYGNVLGSRGSVYGIFKACKTNKFPITSEKMTRFFMIVEDSVKFVMNALNIMVGGEIFIPKMSSIKISDLARGIFKYFSDNEGEIEFITTGIRQGEKLHETLISSIEFKNTLEFIDKYIIKPNFEWFNYIPDYDATFIEGCSLYDSYSSNNNEDFLNVNDIFKYIERIENN